MDLLYDPAAQKQAFVDACAWADDIHMCLGWLEPGDAQGPAFSDLAPHTAKVKQAIVGLARFQSYPSLLWRLYRSSVLRLVSTVDGSFSPNLYVFRRGTSVRTLVASAPFTASRLSKPCESFVVFEGDQDHAFSLRALQLLDRCRALAHLPTRVELEAYEHAWAECRSGGRPPESLLGGTVEACDGGSLGELTAVVEPTAVRDALIAVRGSLFRGTTVRVEASFQAAGPVDGPAVQGTLWWSALGYWSALQRSSTGYALHLGTVAPWEVTRPRATVSLCTGDADVVRDRMTVAQALDGRRFLVHIPASSDDSDDALVREHGSSLRASVIGEIGAADFVQTTAALLQRLRRKSTRTVEMFP